MTAVDIGRIVPCRMAQTAIFPGFDTGRFNTGSFNTLAPRSSSKKADHLIFPKRCAKAGRRQSMASRRAGNPSVFGAQVPRGSKLTC